MELFVDKLMVAEDIKDAFFGLDPAVTRACDKKATEICSNLFPSIDLAMQENIDLVIRPMSAVMALNELLLQNFFSLSSIDGVYSSKTIPQYLKAQLLKNYAALNNISVASSDVDSLYSEITFFMQNNTQNRSSNLTNEMFEEIATLRKLLIVDGFSKELTRNRIPYIQIEHSKLMNFKRNDMNPGTLLGHSYSRDDYEKYQEYKNASSVTIPGSIDVYFHTGIFAGDIVVQRNADGLYHLPAGYYVSAVSEKLYAITAPDELTDGFIKYAPVMSIVDGDENETVKVIMYDDPGFNFEDKDIMVTDIQEKGFYPLFIDLKMYSKDKSIDNSLVLIEVDKYLGTVGWSMNDMSLNDLQLHLNKNGFSVAVSPVSSATLMVYANGLTNQNVTFPLTVADLNIPEEVNKNNITERTVSVFVRSVNVIQE